MRMGVRRTLIAAMMAVIAALACAGSALAADVSIWGAQTYLSEDSTKSDTSMNLLFASGTKGETVYFTAKDGNKPLAEYLPHTLGETVDDGEDAVDVFSATFTGGVSEAKLKDGSYTVEAWDKRGGTKLYGGAVYGVWARFFGASGSEVTQLIGARTVSDSGSFDFVPPTVIYSGKQAYKLASSTPDVQDKLAYYDYEAFDPEDTVDGQINYVDKDGSLLKVDTFPVSTDGSKTTRAIPATIDAENGNRYRTLAFTDSVTAVYPTQTSFTVQCAYMRPAAYVAIIKMVDDKGAVIATDTVNVDGKFNYTAPRTIYKNERVKGESRVVTYELADDEEWPLDAIADAPLVVNGERKITIKYDKKPLQDDQVEVTFNWIDGRENPDVANRVLGSQTKTVTKDNPTAAPDESIEQGDTSFVLAGDVSDYTYTYGSGKTPVIDVYYVPEGYNASAPYDVTVNYVNYVTGEVIRSESFESMAGSILVPIDSPTEFEADGVSYIRLDGQDGGIYHNHYSGMKTYTVYYRDVNDTLHENVVIERTRVITRSGGGGAVTTDAEGNRVTGASATGATTYVSLDPTTGYNVIGGSGNGSLVNDQGQDSNAERTDDNGSSSAQSDGTSTVPTDEGGLIVGGIAAAVVAAIAAIGALIWWFVSGRRRNDENEA